MNTLQKLYDSEINWGLQTYWDAGRQGFTWWLGSKDKGQVASSDADTLEEAISALAEAARKHFPDSAFAKATPGSTTCSTCLDGGCGEGGSCDGDCGDACAQVDFRELLAKMREIAERDGYCSMVGKNRVVRDEEKLCEAAKKELREEAI